MRNYHIVLANGSERNVKASEATVDNGVLSFHNDAGWPTVVYAEGSWTYYEVESRDDTGYPSEPEATPKD